jgi:hypothetical protein
VDGARNPGRSEGEVPGFAGDLMMFAEDAADVRAWILDGGTERRLASESWRRKRDAGALAMPAYRGRLRAAEVDDLVAYVLAVSGSPEPTDSLAHAGLVRARELGCEACHGVGGRLAIPNPGSLKGHVPSWDGVEFAELVRDEAEFREWVRDGAAHRLRANPAARFFLERSTLRMPAYERHLQPGDLEALWAYVQWLRSPAARPDSAAVTAF